MSHIVRTTNDIKHVGMRYITGNFYPIVLFDEPIPFIYFEEIIKENDNAKKCIVTLYIKTFWIHLYRGTDFKEFFH